MNVSYYHQKQQDIVYVGGDLNSFWYIKTYTNFRGGEYFPLKEHKNI